ncbi:MAG: glycerol-3-phosphate acyltransferase, partial [Firmicutes bacterium]|nr:glycerol-3-phosphate acyltransferase [Bacillota bacterium]
YIACLAAFIGHVFPIYYGFKGGKGVAVAFGGLLGVNWKIALLCLATVVVFTLISKRMSVGSIAGAASAIIYALIFEKSFLIYITIMALLIIFMHRGNIKRLLNHEEPPLSFLDKSKKKGDQGK